MSKRNRKKIPQILAPTVSASLERIGSKMRERFDGDLSRSIELSSRTNAVFIFSSFRSSSTWLWSRLRSAKTTLSFYEIFNEKLGKITPEVARLANWDSRHPETAPYFLEYLPLIQESGGVVGYKEEMAFKWYIPPGGIDGDLSREEASYIYGLLDYALSNNKIPVLSCTRLLGRARSIRKKFAGKNILLHRNLFHQWASFSDQAISGNNYFVSSVNAILSCCKHDPFLCALSEWFSDRVESPDNELFFQTFLLMQLYLYGQAYDSFDLTVDSTVLARDVDMRTAVEQELSKLVRAEISLRDCGERFEQSTVSVKSKRAFFDSIEQFTKAIAGRCSPEAANFVEKMKNDALEEWSIHEFYTQRYRGVQSQKLAILSQREAALVTERDVLLRVKNALVAERDELLGEKNALMADRDALVEGRDP